MIPFIELFGHEVSAYGILALLAFLAGALCAICRRKIYGMRVDDIIVVFVLVGVGALVGGKIFYMTQAFPRFLELAETSDYNLFDFFTQAGLVFYGGLIGGLLFLWIAVKLLKLDGWDTFDLIIPTVPLMHAIGRVGCFCAGCCYGIPSEEFGMYFNASPFTPHNVKLLPIQLIEAGCLLVLFAALMIYGRKKRPHGRILAVYFIGYGIIRFVLEYFRYDMYRGIYGAFSISQWVSLVLIAAGFFLLYGYPRLKIQKAAV